MDENQPAQPADPRRTAWAAPVSHLKVTDVPAGALNLNVEGRQPVSPLQGFGQLWQKTYRIALPGIAKTPAEVMAEWKARFADFQPAENHFYPSLSGIKPGEVLFINATVPAFPGSPSILPVASGVMVLYADDLQFTVMTPEGFPESGWNTFSVEEEDGLVSAQIQSLCRAADPLYEFAFRFMGSAAQQEKIWNHVLQSLAAFYGVQNEVVTSKKLVDSRTQWRKAANIFDNAAIRTVFYILSAPLRRLRPRKRTET